MPVNLGEKIIKQTGADKNLDENADNEDGTAGAGKIRRKRRKPKKPKKDLPSGLPDHWPNSTTDELALRPVRHIEVGNPQTFAYQDNFIRTAQFTKWDFLPRFLMDEFNPKTKVANVYFLCIAGLQCFTTISVTRGVPTTLIPLLLLVIVDAAFVLIQDAKRHRADFQANSTVVSRYDFDNVRFQDTIWRHLEVGDFVQVQSRSIIPADLVIISVSEKSDIPTGKCFVETKSLDGETNLKARQALSVTYHDVSTVRALDQVRGTLSMEHPNRSIHSFQGVFQLEAAHEGAQPATCEVSKDNIILRGSVLRNCDWIIGLVVNTGRDTKIHMSMPHADFKMSKLETMMQIEIRKVFLLLLFLCCAGALGQWVWGDHVGVTTVWYLGLEENNYVSAGVTFCRFLLVHAPIVPVSLYVSIAVARHLQSYFMRHDLEMYYEAEDSPMDVKNMCVNEDLGQVSHVMTDKTGTLTCNIMDFRKMSVHGIPYGAGISGIARTNWENLGKEIPKDIMEGEEKAQANAVKHVAFYCPEYEKVMANHGPQRSRIQQFFRALAICHDAEIEFDPTVKDGNRLSCSNPDDEALICAADYFGYKFIGRADNGHIKFENRYSRLANNVEEVEILHLFTFSSKKRMMGMITKDVVGTITFFVKGADTAIEPLIDINGDGMENVIKLTALDRDRFSKEGLRVLYVASRVISKEKYSAWNKEYNKQRIDLRQLERQKRGETNTLDDLIEDLQQNMILMGCTGIEDRLQFGVTECVEELIAAGINIWMLTGDGQETAVNSGLAAKVLLPDKFSMHCIFDRKAFKTKLDMRNAFRRYINEFDHKLEEDGLSVMQPWYLIIDGATLAIAMEDKAPEGMRYLLSELVMRCRSVVGCRVSPSQKREIVFFLREQKGAIVLAIGDGANDMPMIRSAHVGIGILGQEGGQAASCADYSICQFRYMSPLLLKHGQSNYIRMANLVCYIFYKNLLLSLSMFWFNLNCGFSSQSIYSEGGIQLYNLFYTSLPIIYYAAHDMMYNRTTFYRFPQTYRACINDHFFGTRVFWSWMGTAAFESLFLGIIPLYLMTGVDTEFGYMSSFQMPGMMSLTAIVICANTKIAFIQNKFHWTHYALILAGIVSWFATCIVIGEVTDFDWNVYKEYRTVLAGPYSWLGLLLCLGIVIGRDLYSAAVSRHFNFEPYHIVQEADVEQTKRLERHNIGRSVASTQPDGGGAGPGRRRSVAQQEGARTAPLPMSKTKNAESQVLTGVDKGKDDVELAPASRTIASRPLSKDNDPNRQFSTPRSGYAPVASAETRSATPV